MRSHRYAFNFLLTLILFFFNNCYAQELSEKIMIIGGDCNPGEAIFSNDSIIDDQSVNLVTFDSITSNRFSDKSRLTALNLGLGQLLIKFSMLEGNKSTDSLRILFLEIKQKINDYILLCNFDINTTIAEINCQIQELEELRVLGEREVAKKNRQLTLSSLFIGFGTAAVASSFDVFSPDKNVLIGTISFAGSAIASYIVLRQIKLKKTFTMMHYRNPLADIYYAPGTSSFYPPTVWSFLNNQTYVLNDSLTNRKFLMLQFNEMEILKNEKKISSEEKEKTYFGTIGTYSLDLLDNKIYMMDILSKRIAIMRYDLKVLEQEILIE